jgi:hypothetical protein
MKNSLKTGIALLALASTLGACKGGFSGEKQDSTMLDKETMDSSAALNSKAGTMAADSNSAGDQDTAKRDTTRNPQK